MKKARLLRNARDPKRQLSRLELLRKEVQKGLDDLKRGNTVSAAKAFAVLDRDLNYPGS